MEEKANRNQKRKNKNDLGDNFIAPDGGYGWLIAIACGFANFCLYPCLQSFGLIYRERLLFLGLTNTKITTIFSVHLAIASSTGLLNGPIFRRFSVRQVALSSTFLAAFGIFISSYVSSFMMYLFSYSLLYGFGRGMTLSSAIFVTNTYFRKKRMQATGYAWTITGLGPIIVPYLANILDYEYGYQGMVLIFSGIALNSFVCAVAFQPVQLHVNSPVKKISISNITTLKSNFICFHCKSKNENSYHNQAFVSDEKNVNIVLSTLNESNIDKAKKKNYNKFNTFPVNKKNEMQKFQSQADLDLITDKYNTICFCRDTKTGVIIKEDSPLKWYQKIKIFFDFDLFSDFTFVILMLGLTLTIFADTNFSVLTPFILSDFGFTNSQIAFAMSIIGIVDVIVRLILPFILKNVKLSDQLFFMISTIILVIGRFLIALKPSFTVILIIFCFMGIGKGLRTIFMNIIIPNHVPLKRLPAASGLQLLTAGIFAIICGPVVGAVRDATNFPITIHFLNVISMITILSWTLQMLYKKYGKNS